MEPTVNYAGFWRRLGAALADGVVVTIAIGLIGIVLEAIGIQFVDTVTVQATTVGGAQIEGHAELTTAGLIVSIVVSWLYFALMESGARQATLGKRMIGLRVTGLSGGCIGFGRATGRYFAKYLSSFILMIGYIMAGVTPRKQALHDMIAGCLVVSGKP